MVSGHNSTASVTGVISATKKDPSGGAYTNNTR